MTQSLRFSLAALPLLLLACSEPPTGSDDAGQGGARSGNTTIGINPGGGTPVGAGEVNCGDGILNSGEACDDKNEESGDGCADSCLLVEPGFTCSVPGEECRPYARCGDGVVSFPEQCDDGGLTVGDGCSANCKVEVGFKCDGDTCVATTCGDSIIEGAEACDDGNAIPFDGCDSRCQKEPDCKDGACTSTCGDGLRLGEECDDGNTTSGDGCSDECKREKGYVCETPQCELVNGACALRVPVVYRDFRTTHTDFDEQCGGDTIREGIVEDDLDASGLPVRVASPPADVCVDAFDDWYRSKAGINGTIVSDLLLFENGKGGYVNRYLDDGTRWTSNGLSFDGNPYFFPIDTGDGIITPAGEFSAAGTSGEYLGGGSAPADSGSHNFHFTSHVQYWFAYDAGITANLDFLGDDDVWVFVNGKLALDIGGLHSPKSGQLTINSLVANKYGLKDGNVYPISIFHAERKRNGSSFRLTLSGFDGARSECLPDCGDGLIGAGEECDDGVNDGGYNECQPGCTLGDFCGDGQVQPGEECDDRDPNGSSGCSGCRMIVVR